MSTAWIFAVEYAYGAVAGCIYVCLALVLAQKIELFRLWELSLSLPSHQRFYVDQPDFSGIAFTAKLVAFAGFLLYIFNLYHFGPAVLNAH